jgi:hypothetical protein
VGLLFLGIGASLVLPRPRDDTDAVPPGPEMSGKS